MPDRLIRAANRTARTADQISARFARQLSRILRDTERQLRDLLQDVIGGNISAMVRAVQLSRIRQDIRNALRMAGYDELARAAVNEPLDHLASQVLSSRAAEDVARLASDSTLRLQTLKQLHLDNLLDEGSAIARLLEQAVGRHVLGSQAPAKLWDELRDLLDKAETRVTTLYDTAVSIYGRQVEAEQAGDDPDTVFVYLGPIDAKTREWCLERVGRVYTRAEIDEMDNGQLSNCFLTGGGYNCRHVWHEVSKFSELYPLAGTTTRAPEMQVEVEHVRAMP